MSERNEVLTLKKFYDDLKSTREDLETHLKENWELLIVLGLLCPPVCIIGLSVYGCALCCEDVFKKILDNTKKEKLD